MYVFCTFDSVLFVAKIRSFLGYYTVKVQFEDESLNNKLLKTCFKDNKIKNATKTISHKCTQNIKYLLFTLSESLGLRVLMAF